MFSIWCVSQCQQGFSFTKTPTFASSVDCEDTELFVGQQWRIHQKAHLFDIWRFQRKSSYLHMKMKKHMLFIVFSHVFHILNSHPFTTHLDQRHGDALNPPISVPPFPRGKKCEITRHRSSRPLMVDSFAHHFHSHHRAQEGRCRYHLWTPKKKPVKHLGKNGGVFFLVFFGWGGKFWTKNGEISCDFWDVLQIVWPSGCLHLWILLLQMQILPTLEMFRRCTCLEMHSNLNRSKSSLQYQYLLALLSYMRSFGFPKDRSWGKTTWPKRIYKNLQNDSPILHKTTLPYTKAT